MKIKRPLFPVSTFCLLSLFQLVSFSVFSEENDVKTDFYGSLRMGLDYVDAGTDDDAVNGRDFLSRLGVDISSKTSEDALVIAKIEYGLGGNDGVNFVQNQNPGLRQVYAGLKGRFGQLTYGSQTIIWHQFVRAAYFSDGLDTLRQGVIRDDDMLQWEKKTGDWKFGAALQMEGQDGDSFDQYQLAAEYQSGDIKLQTAVAIDLAGDSTGGLYGARGWYYFSKTFTVSAFYHLAEKDFDLYSGNSSGNVRLVSAVDSGEVSGVTGCKNEDRATAAVYGKWRSGENQVHARYAVNDCAIKGDVSSVKVEYIHYLSNFYRLWGAYEQLSSDDSRLPETGEDMSELQLGVRFDF